MPSYRIRGTGKNLRPEKEGDYIGFIGCEQVGLLPVRMAADRRVLRVTCPRCGELHMTTDPMPRLRRPGEIVTLVEDGMPMAVVMPVDGLRVRQSEETSDASLLRGRSILTAELWVPYAGRQSDLKPPE